MATWPRWALWAVLVTAHAQQPQKERRTFYRLPGGHGSRGVFDSQGESNRPTLAPKSYVVDSTASSNDEHQHNVPPPETGSSPTTAGNSALPALGDKTSVLPTLIDDSDFVKTPASAPSRHFEEPDEDDGSPGGAPPVSPAAPVESPVSEPTDSGEGLVPSTTTLAPSSLQLLSDDVEAAPTIRPTDFYSIPPLFPVLQPTIDNDLSTEAPVASPILPPTPGGAGVSTPSTPESEVPVVGDRSFSPVSVPTLDETPSSSTPDESPSTSSPAILEPSDTSPTLGPNGAPTASPMQVPSFGVLSPTVGPAGTPVGSPVQDPNNGGSVTLSPGGMPVAAPVAEPVDNGSEGSTTLVPTGSPVDEMPVEPPNTGPAQDPNVEGSPSASPDETPAMSPVQAPPVGDNGGSSMPVAAPLQEPDREGSSSTAPNAAPGPTPVQMPILAPSRKPSINDFASPAPHRSPTSSIAPEPSATLAPIRGSPAQGGTLPPDGSVTPSPFSLSLVPSEAPAVATAPTWPRGATILEKCRMSVRARHDALLVELQNYSHAQLLEEESSSQSIAYKWLSSVDDAIVCPGDPDVLQRYALAVTYYALGGDEWVNGGWLDFSSECDWYGVTCNEDGQITVLQLKNNNLSGEIPSEVFLLPMLSGLSLDHNSIGGQIPVEIGVANLTYFEFDDNQLEGSLPDGIFQMISLRAIDLNGNRLSGTVSNDIGNLVNLMVLQLENNRFNDNIPAEGLSKLQDMLLLTLHGNAMVGSLEPVCATVDNRRAGSPEYLQFFTTDCGGDSPLTECLCCSQCF